MEATDIIGQRFGRLVVTKRDYSKMRKRPYWLCKCDCGKEKIVRGSHLESGGVKSCGCLREEVKDMIGQKFGILIVIKRAGKHKDRHAKWLCKCKCGKEKVINGKDLRLGFTKSCGCLQTFPFGIAMMRAAMGRYKYQAKKRNLDFNLTQKQFAEITQKDCQYCGAKPNNISKNSRCNGDYIYNGIDRVDNGKGYIIDNIVPCCITCNLAKGKSSLQEYKDWIGRSYKKMFSKKERREEANEKY